MRDSMTGPGGLVSRLTGRGPSRPESTAGAASIPQAAGPLGLSLLLLLGGLLASLLFLTPAARAADGCPNAQYRSGPSANLPDCRAYEQVSPTDKGGSDVSMGALGGPPKPAAPGQVMVAAENGQGVAYASSGTFAGSEGALPLNAYLGQRTAAGWSTRGLSVPMNPSSVIATVLAQWAHYDVFSSDLRYGIVDDVGTNGPMLAPGAVDGYPNLYVRDLASDAFRAVTTVTPPSFTPNSSTLEYHPIVQGASRDFSHVVFAAADALTPNAQAPCSGCFNLYENVGGQLRLVNVLPGNLTTTTDATAGSAGDYQSMKTPNANVAHAVSTDGTKIYWTDSSHGPGNIYVRVDGQRTVAVGNGRWWAASSDGSRAIFTTPGDDLYEFDLATGTSTALVAGADVKGIVGQSDDLSYIYFLADGVLAPGATAGASNLYLWHAGNVRLVATLPSTDKTGVTTTELSVATIKPMNRAAYVTPNGLYLAFMSGGSLTNYDNLAASGVAGCPDETESGNITAHLRNWGDKCPEVFFYDATTEKLSCASCNPSGARPLGPSGIPNWRNQLTASRVVSDDGSGVFFESSDALVPGDTNAQQDVYMWQPTGSRGCRQVHGCVSLISGGTDGAPDPSVANAPRNYFVDASASGEDVFFTTTQQLVPSDDDSAADLYDARVDGGLAVQHPSGAAVPCVGDVCKGAPTSPPAAPALGSGLYAGPGNVHADERHATTFRLLAVSRRQRLRLAAGRRIALRVRVSGAGTVRALIRGRLGRRGSVRALARGHRRTAGAGTVRVGVRLSKPARRYLRRHGRLRVTVRVRYSQAEGSLRKRMVLPGHRSRRSHARQGGTR